jgi:hypothetical protein
VRAVAAVLGVLTFAAPAAAAPQPLAPIGYDASFALAGEQILRTRTAGRVLTVERVSGGALLRFQAHEGAHPTGFLVASPERGALLVRTEDTESTLATSQSFAGALDTPWEALTPLVETESAEWITGPQQVDGAIVFRHEFAIDFSSSRWIVHEPGADTRELRLPPRAGSESFAGDLLAYVGRVRGQRADDEGHRLVIVNWRTGAKLTDIDFGRGIEETALRADGQVVFVEDGGGLFTLQDGRPVRLTKGGTGVSFAGDRIVFVRQKGEVSRLAVLDPDGTVRGFGMPTSDFGGYVADETRVLWSANGCLLLDDVTSPAADAPAAGPCGRTEVRLVEPSNVRLRRSRFVPARVQCLSGPDGCRGRITLQDENERVVTRTRSFRIAATGESRRLLLRLTPRGRRTVLRQACPARLGGAGLSTRLVAIDPDGRERRLIDHRGLLVLSRAACPKP